MRNCSPGGSPKAMTSNSSRMHVRRPLALVDQRPPGAVAGIERHDMRCALLSHRRADAVGADQQVRFDRFAIGKMRRHRTRILREARKPPPAVIVLRRKGVAQQAVDALPGGQPPAGNRSRCVTRPSRSQNLSRGDSDTERVGGKPQTASGGRSARIAPRCRRRARTIRSPPARRRRRPTPRAATASPLSRPLIEPPMTTARLLPDPAN